ncbi:uncharacterized protein LOC115995966 [Ipomoea triloba]|uniref:uncharacterized protein LOC115995966 n=1 Tax=Ipomoea triloba TaxID=35885 RepID=UPI00125E0606|nr:uncharacterized protein LOC115995966 [Ipomoea triloba]
MQTNPNIEYRMRLIGKRTVDARTYNLPTVSEVAALIVGDLDPSLGHRDILVETRSGALKRINELNLAYLPLQYPIVFPYGEDGYREDIQFSLPKNEDNGGRVRVSQREFFAYKIYDRFNEVSTMLYAKRLFQQFLVDAYTMVESSRLLYIRNNQKALRCEAYKGMSDALTRGEVDTTNQRKRIILPSSFTCGARYMIQNYQDAMAICRHKGYPNLFITFTCNPKWPEIQRYMKKCNLNAEDSPDIVCRVFQMNLDSLVKEIRAGNLFGVVTAVVYTIEFQKRGLPHAHILIFLERTTTLSTASCMDSFISAEIPDKEVDKEYYDAVEEFMIHGPCGLYKSNSPCMVNKKSSKHFPKKFVAVSSWDDDGYPIYRRRDNGRNVQKNGVQLDSRHPSVERLSFHLPDCQSIIFEDDDKIQNVLNRPTISHSMFTAWFDANKTYESAKVLAYIDMPTKFVWKKDLRQWHPWKRGFSIGRIFYVPPGSGEIYYLRCLLNLVRGPTNFEDIK